MLNLASEHVYVMFVRKKCQKRKRKEYKKVLA